ncbi:MAG: hypothetical protein JWR85_4064 [Marmoricola sp.]|nr:hypothetical protein [Marmoricola sp.]
MIMASTVRIARLDEDGDWVSLGTTALTFAPIFDEAEYFRVTNRLIAPTTISVAFQPSRQMLRILIGPRWAWDRHHHRVVTRRKYRHRKGRR